MLEALTFLSPGLLAALAALPLLWWLLRVMPPRAKTVHFPALFLLKDITAKLKTTAHTPWWLLLLRCLAAGLFILAFAEPVLHPAEELPGGRGSVVMVVDNGWAAAAHWPARLAKMKETLRRVQRSGRPIVLLPTAPDASDGKVHSHGPMDVVQAEAWLTRLAPQPWPTAAGAAADVFEKLAGEQSISYAMLFSDGLVEDKDGSRRLLQRLSSVVTDDDVNNPVLLRAGEDKEYTLERLHAAAKDRDVRIVAYTRENNVADEMKVTFPAGETQVTFTWEMLPEVRNKTARLALRDPVMASAVFLANSRWRQHPVGVIADAGQKESRNFLSEVYYLRRALEANGTLNIDSLPALLKGSVSALVLPDSTALTAAEKEALAAWVEAGGFLIRFAGPNLAAGANVPSSATSGADEALLPVPLRAGQRALEGAMTWEKPVHLGALAEQSPLFGLDVPEDVTVTRQVLADPSPDVFEKTWLQLEDGTPLITGARSGKGTLVLIHTSAGPDWSNFCYSGLFVEALQRMVALSNGINTYKAQTTLPPLLLLDGFGVLKAPDGPSAAKPIAPAESFYPSPQTPPGLYGDAAEFQAFNMGDALPSMQALKDIPARVTVDSYARAGEVEFKSPLLKLALLLLLIDTAATLRLRGVMGLLFALLVAATPAQAAEEPKDLAAGLYLAYIETGDQDIDRTSFNGLSGLGEVISARTTARVKGVVGLNPDHDDLSFYPIIYWPMAERQPGLTMTAANNIQSYLAEGGMILFDTRDRQFGNTEGSLSSPGARKLRELTQSIQIPELIAVPHEHILTRSFYLLDDFPGRYAGGKLWVEKEPSARHDGVTSVLIGANDWAAAWTKDPNDQSRFGIEPGGEQQREMAYRFGVNLVMVALTGNYKADQVHIPYILERIGP